jgi:hypothetical protein
MTILSIAFAIMRCRSIQRPKGRFIPAETKKIPKGVLTMKARVTRAMSWYTMRSKMAFAIVNLTDGARSGRGLP